MILNKYTKAQHGLAYLKEGFLRFSPLLEFNDPFEMRPYIESLGTHEQEEAIVRRLEKEDEGFRRLSPDQKAAVRLHARTHGPAELSLRMARDLQGTVGVLCLVKDSHQDLLMWAHYADSHRGCVLQFDGSHSWFVTKQGSNAFSQMGVLKEVRYSSARPRSSLLALTMDDLLTKAECWGYEKEWRMLLNLKDCTTQIHGGKEVNGLFPVPHEALTGVYLGVNIDAEDREQFLHLLPAGKSVNLFQFELDQQGYSLVARQIN